MDVDEDEEKRNYLGFKLTNVKYPLMCVCVCIYVCVYDIVISRLSLSLSLSLSLYICVGGSGFGCVATYGLTRPLSYIS